MAAPPAAPVMIAGHLASLAVTLGRSGLRRRLAAIAHHHRQTGRPWETRQSLRLRWSETGGPSLPGPLVQRGFGLRALDGTVRGQLSGKVSLAWKERWLVCDLAVPLAHTAGTAPGGLAAE